MPSLIVSFLSFSSKLVLSHLSYPISLVWSNIREKWILTVFTNIPIFNVHFPRIFNRESFFLIAKSHVRIKEKKKIEISILFHRNSFSFEKLTLLFTSSGTSAATNCSCAHRLKNKRAINQTEVKIIGFWLFS